MPLNIDFVQVLLHLLNFVILAGGLTLLVYKPVMKFLDARRARYEALEEQNQAAKEESDRLQKAYASHLADAEAEIAEKRLKAEREGAETARAYLDGAREKAAAIVAAAEAEAETRRAQILDSAQTEIGELVLEATQKLLTDSADAERTAALYDAFLRRAEEDAKKRAEP
ncbi:MAG: ATP synthase F0 subunit B [Ruminococcaceae bacterium]|nr:ATP synthase F0 subunit B [Oscillospiraceae bacterium]